MLKSELFDTARFRATAGATQGFGATPVDALGALMSLLPETPDTPIVIWPYNRGDAFFTDAQQARLNDLKARQPSLSVQEKTELEQLIEAAFDATVSRMQSLQQVKS